MGDELRAEEIGALYLEEARDGFRTLRREAERALAQLGDDDLWATLDSGSNSVGVIVRHLSGNLRSRWTEFLTTDGEKPDRDRDGEFEPPRGMTRAALMAEWEDAWARVEAELEVLTPPDLLRTVTIRGEPNTALRAIERSTRHLASHVGQIVLLAKHLCGPEWRTLSIPRGQSRTWRPPPPQT